MRDRALILGATGMLGHICVGAFGSRFEVYGSVRDPRSGPAATLDAELVRFDAWSDDVEQLLDKVGPAVVVNCIGLVKQLREAARPRAAIRLNALLPHELAETCAARDIRLIQISTDCVFSGRLPLGERYGEDAEPDPSDLYGRSKLMGEVPAPALTIRTSIIGPELERQAGLLEWFRSQRGGTVTGFRQAIFSGLTTAALAELLVTVAVLDEPPRGLYHVASEPISKYDLLVALRDALGLGCEIAGADEPVVNRALDGSRFARETGLRVPSWDQMLAPYRTEADAAAA
jgi:dTDP-4-dehydrorhamnose reductase